MELTPKLMSISAVVEGLEGVIGKKGVVVLRSALAHGSSGVRPGGRVGFDGRGGVVVVDGCEGVGLCCEGARGDGGPHPDRGVFRAVSRHEDVNSLANAKGDNVGLVRFDGHEVVCDDRHGVLVNGEMLQAFCTCIYEAEAMGFAFCELKG